MVDMSEIFEHFNEKCYLNLKIYFLLIEKIKSTKSVQKLRNLGLESRVENIKKIFSK